MCAYAPTRNPRTQVGFDYLMPAHAPHVTPFLVSLTPSPNLSPPPPCCVPLFPTRARTERTTHRTNRHASIPGCEATERQGQIPVFESCLLLLLLLLTCCGKRGWSSRLSVDTIFPDDLFISDKLCYTCKLSFLFPPLLPRPVLLHFGLARYTLCEEIPLAEGAPSFSPALLVIGVWSCVLLCFNSADVNVV